MHPRAPSLFWFQPGTETDEAIRVATEAGLTVISRRCIGVTHGALGLGPGPHHRGSQSGRT